MFIFVCLSLTDTFRKALDKYGHIDIVVNNAGIGKEETQERRSLMVDINLVCRTKVTQLLVTKDEYFQ